MRKIVLFVPILLLLAGCLRSLDGTALPSGGLQTTPLPASPVAATETQPADAPEAAQPAPATATAASATAAPSATPMPSVSPTATLGPEYPPGDLQGLQSWLVHAWQAGDPSELVQARLQEAGWLRPEPYEIWLASGESRAYPAWTAVDMDGDARPEWLFTVVSGLDGCGYPDGSLWLVGASGILEWAGDGETFGAPMVAGQADFNGDGLPEALALSTNCPVHTLEQALFLFGMQAGSFINLVSIANELYRAAEPLRGAVEAEMDEWLEPPIVITQPAYEILDVNGDGLPDLLLNGGGYGDPEAGEVRQRSETWAWDGQAVSLQAIWFQPSGQRFDTLYDANLALELGDLPEAEALYLQVLESSSLLDGVGFAEPEDNRAAARQFAALRLELIGMLRGSLSAAQQFRDLLAEQYPGAPLAQAADRLLENWRSSADLAAACQAASSLLEGFESPTGSLAQAGYGNPSLGAGEICPRSILAGD